MFRSLRSLFRRFTTPTPADTARRRLFSEQQELAKEIRKAFRAYERRLAYLEQRLIRHSDDDLTRDERVFEASHKALTQVLQRLRAADADADALVREWQDWHRASQDVTTEQQRTRLELLRSELHLRGIFPSAPERSSASAQPVPARQRPKRRYAPTQLSSDALEAVDRIYEPRLRGSHTEASHLLRRLWHHGHPLQTASIAKQVKHLHGLRRRWQLAIGRGESAPRA